MAALNLYISLHSWRHNILIFIFFFFFDHNNSMCVEDLEYLNAKQLFNNLCKARKVSTKPLILTNCCSIWHKIILHLCMKWLLK